MLGGVNRRRAVHVLQIQAFICYGGGQKKKKAGEKAVEKIIRENILVLGRRFALCRDSRGLAAEWERSLSLMQPSENIGCK